MVLAKFGINALKSLVGGMKLSSRLIWQCV